MKNKYRLTLSVLAFIFVVSFFMPAYIGYGDVLAGYNCAWICLMLPFETGEDLFSRLYYPLFNISNLLTCFFFVSMFSGRAQHVIWVKWLGGASIIHLLSLPIMNSFSDIKIGYYVWAFCIISVWILYCRSKEYITDK